jgi:hypothetical protein
VKSQFKVGDHVECVLSIEEQNARRERDAAKAKKENVSFFMGKAVTYMHTDEAYVVEDITETGGLRLRGFAATVSPKDVRISDKPTCR